MFKVPGPFGKSRVVLCDPKAIAHFYSRETFGYIKTELVRAAVDSLVCFFPELFFFEYNLISCHYSLAVDWCGRKGRVIGGLSRFFL